MPRPPGTKYPRRLLIYTTDQDMDLLQALADQMDRSQASVVRLLIREKAKDMGIAAPPSPTDD